MVKKVLRKDNGQAKKTTSTKSPDGTLKKLNQGELYSLITKKAYEFYQRRGYNHGNDLRDWYEAEKAVMSNLKK